MITFPLFIGGDYFYSGFSSSSLEYSNLPYSFFLMKFAHSADFLLRLILHSFSGDKLCSDDLCLKSLFLGGESGLILKLWYNAFGFLTLLWVNLRY